MSALFRTTRAADFDRLYRHHAPSVYRYAFAVLGNQADAEDVTQQTFLNAYRAIADGTKPRKAENWLLRIAHNELRRHFRTNGRAVEVELDERLAQPVSESSEPSLADVLRALRQLPPIQRAALVMREFEGRSYKEIAEVLDISESALETLIFRARRGLAENLKGALTCTEAEQALSRRLDGRLARRETRRLKAHLHECALCVRFAAVQKRQRSLLKGLSVMPVPASLFLFRGEPAAAAALGGSAAAVGGSSAVGATAAGAGTGGLAAGFFAKAAAVTAAAAVAGGVGYDVATGPAPTTKTGAKVAYSAAVAQPPASARTQLRAARRRAHRLASGLSTVASARRKVAKAKMRPTNRAPQAGNLAAEKRPARLQHLRKKPKPALVVKTRSPRAPAKASSHRTRTRTRGTNRPGVGKPDTKPPRPARGAEKPKRPDVVLPPASNAAEAAQKKSHG